MSPTHPGWRKPTQPRENHAYDQLKPRKREALSGASLRIICNRSRIGYAVREFMRV